MKNHTCFEDVYDYELHTHIHIQPTPIQASFTVAMTRVSLPLPTHFCRLKYFDLVVVLDYINTNIFG